MSVVENVNRRWNAFLLTPAAREIMKSATDASNATMDRLFLAGLAYTRGVADDEHHQARGFGTFRNRLSERGEGLPTPQPTQSFIPQFNPARRVL